MIESRGEKKGSNEKSLKSDLRILVRISRVFFLLISFTFLSNLLLFALLDPLDTTQVFFFFPFNIKTLEKC